MTCDWNPRRVGSVIWPSSIVEMSTPLRYAFSPPFFATISMSCHSFGGPGKQYLYIAARQGLYRLRMLAHGVARPGK